MRQGHWNGKTTTNCNLTGSIDGWLCSIDGAKETLHKFVQTHTKHCRLIEYNKYFARQATKSMALAYPQAMWSKNIALAESENELI